MGIVLRTIPRMGMEPVVTYFDEAMQLAEWGDTFVVRWIGETPIAGTRRMAEAHKRFIARRRVGTTFALNHIETPNVRPPSDEMRAVIRAYDEEVTPSLRASVTIVDGGGFAGAVVRGILSGLNLVKRRTAPAGVFSAIPPALAFLAQHGGPCGTPRMTLDEVTASYARLRALPNQS